MMPSTSDLDRLLLLDREAVYKWIGVLLGSSGCLYVGRQDSNSRFKYPPPAGPVAGAADTTQMPALVLTVVGAETAIG